MKNILKIIFLLSTLFITSLAFATSTSTDYCSSDEAKKIEGSCIYLSTKVPWAVCVWVDSSKKTLKDTLITPTYYWCIVPKWMNWVMTFFGQLIKYFTFIATLAGVLYIVVNGILLSTSWFGWSSKDEVKKRISKTITWLIILLTSWFILATLFPWIYK